jgi:hypothetical protein
MRGSAAHPAIRHSATEDIVRVGASLEDLRATPEKQARKRTITSTATHAFLTRGFADSYML